MKNIIITKISNENIPYDLLLLADPSITLIRKYLKVSECYIATLEEKIIGAYLLRLNTPSEIELLNIAVAPIHSKLGIGTYLLKSAIQNARLSKAKKLVLGTGTFGYQLSFYQRQGFRVESIVKNFFLDNYDEDIIEDGIQHKDMLKLYLEL